jgi:hypothetical protein
MKDQLQLYDGGIAAWIGCNDNYCLCSEKFAEAENMLASDTLEECSYVSHMAAATSILSEYCQQKGYTSLNGATSLNTIGIRKNPFRLHSVLFCYWLRKVEFVRPLYVHEQLVAEVK